MPPFDLYFCVNISNSKVMCPLLFLFYLCMQIESSTVMAPNSLQLEIWTNGHGPWVQGSFKKFSNFFNHGLSAFFSVKILPLIYNWSWNCLSSPDSNKSGIETFMRSSVLQFLAAHDFFSIILSPSMGSATTQPTKCSLNCLPPPSHATIIRHLRWQRGGEFLIGSFFQLFFGWSSFLN